MTLVEEAHIMARQRTLREIEDLSKGRKRTDVEHMACMFAMENEVEARMAGKKAKAIEKEVRYDTEREKAETLYLDAKDRLRLEKEYHRRMEESFAEEKVKHGAEKERHRIAEEGFTEEKAKHRAEKERHRTTEDSFANEKHRHRDERARHAKAVAQFQKDAEPWRKIVRAEKEEARAVQAKADKGIDDFVAGQS